MKLKPLTIGPVTLGGKTPAFYSWPVRDRVGSSSSGGWRGRSRKSAPRRNLPFIFKASYDKANRTSVRSFRGIGVREGCELLARDRARNRDAGHDGCAFA